MNPVKSNTGNLNNYKTKKCRHYEIGKCKLGNLCNFAHGDQELRSSKQHDSMTPKSKSINNQQYSDVGEAYERILLLENRMEATFNTQRMILTKLKQTYQNNQLPSGQYPNKQVKLLEYID